MSDKSIDLPSRSDVIYEVDWVSIAPWTTLFRGPGIALSFQVLLFAFLGMVFSGCLFQEQVSPIQWNSFLSETNRLTLPEEILSPFSHDFVPEQDLVPEGEKTNRFFWLYQTYLVFVWSFFGLAISMAAARAFSFGEEQSLKASFRHNMTRWPKLLAAIAIVLGALALPLLLLWLYGLFIRIPVVGLLGILLCPVAILLGIVLVILGIGFLVGFPFLVAAIAVEIPDPFDAVSRMYAYVWQRVARLVCYLGLALLIGLVFALAVECFGAGTLYVFDRLVNPIPEGLLNRSTDWWGQTFLVFLRSTYAAYFFTSTTIIYLLLRQDIDGQSMEEID